MTGTAIITGATSGIGRATALRLARAGFHIIATGRSHERGAETVRQIKAAGGSAEFHSFDVTAEGDWAAFADTVTKAHRSVDALINSAGSFFSKPLPDTTLEEFRDLWTADVESVVLGTKYGMRMMRDTRSAGSIVNISSLAGLIGLDDCSAYCAAKAAVTHFSRVAALEGAQMDPKVRVNSLNPGVIYTEMITGAYGDSDEVKAFVMDGNALQRVGTAEDIASAATFLASPAARMVTGTAMLVDGGRGAD
ncbi:SDR family NAD(P)-dependent oxidoreductase [Blastomonas fulva]|uniref:SDR family NAD(P)-dependent oxidoreductase n=1 Tax=Blastomonas fulva TaxID=1550728 RepID=UPI003F701766